MSVSFRPGARLTHMKGMPYQFLFYARHSETMEEVPVYECLYVNPRGTLWVRPRAMFEETVERPHEKACLDFPNIWLQTVSLCVSIRHRP